MKRSLLDLTVIIILALIAGSLDCAAASLKKPSPRPVPVTTTPVTIGTPPAMPTVTTTTTQVVYTVAQIEALKAQLRQGIQTAGLHAAMIPEGKAIFVARAEAFDQVLENLEKLSPTTVQVVATR